MSAFLRNEAIQFETCDDLYESADDFESLYNSIVERLLSGRFDVYAVPGHPMFGEETVRLLLERRQDVEIFPAPSFADAVLAAIRKPFSGPLQIWNAHDPQASWVDPRSCQLVYQLDAKDIASNAKIWLLRFFPPEHPVIVVSGAGGKHEKVSETTLVDLDRFDFDALTSAFLQGIPLERPFGFYGLVSIVDTLLGPGGCPWDREQTHQTLKTHLLEEAYETIEAIDSGDADRLQEELGDLLLQPLMHSQIDAIQGLYDIDDVIEAITSKLIRRHPHVFGDQQAHDARQVLRNWDSVKKAERGEESILKGVPKRLPALLQAYEVSKRAARVGFDWPSLESVWAKVFEEQRELEDAIRKHKRDDRRVEEEVADLLFALVNVARWLGVEPEDALRKMVNRFVKRFQQMELRANKPLTELSANEWDALWNEAKAVVKSQ